MYVNSSSNIYIENSTIVTQGGAGYGALVSMYGGSATINGAVLTAVGGFAIYSEGESGEIATVLGEEAEYQITGTIAANDYSGIDLTLADGSLFLGKTSVAASDSSLYMAIKGGNSLWNVTGNSTLTSLALDGSVVNYLDTPTGTTITVGNLGSSTSDSGIFRMNTDIENEHADMLIVTGTAQGTYVLDVQNDGGQATTGLEFTDLVSVNAGQSALFTLDHEVELGGWLYELAPPDVDSLESGTLANRPSHSGSTWYLRATGEASNSGSGAINSFAGSYLMAYAETNTLIQRMGDLRHSPYGQGLWFRAHGGKFESNAKSYVRGFDMKYGGVQIGYDRKIADKSGGDIYAGVMFGYSKGDLDYYAEGSGEVDSKALGLYGTYIGKNGFYIDTVLKYQWMTNDFDVIDTAGTLVRGNDADTGGLGFSVEFGQRVPFGGAQKSGWYAEPQIQFSYQYQDGDYFNATNGLRIGVDSFTSIIGRLGILVGYETEKINFYGKVSRVKEFDGDLTIRANGVPIDESFGGSWWVYGIGFTSRLSDRNSIYMDVERTSGGSFRQPWAVRLGWRTIF